MSKHRPEEVLAVLEEQAAEDEARAVAKMSDAELDEELRRAGIDPDKALSEVPAAPGATVAESAPVSAEPARAPRPRARWSTAWIGAAAVAACFAILLALWQRDQGQESVGATPGRDVAREASELRDRAFAAC